MNLAIMPVVAGRAMTLDCVASLKAQDIPVHIMLIDNGSEDCGPMLRSLAGPDVHVITHSKRQSLNRVWNDALNLAFGPLNLEYALVVNNDTVLRPDTFRLLRDDGGVFVTAVGQRTPVAPLTELSGDLRAHRRPHPDFSCFLIRRACWELVGQFDECFHAYCADCDYHLRMHRAGVQAWSLPIPFEHIASGTLKNASNALRDAIQREADEDRETFKCKYGFLPATLEYEEVFK